MLEYLFSQMWRNTDLVMDRKAVDITGLKKTFGKIFDPKEPHDAYKFLVHMINGIARETINFSTIRANKKLKKKNVVTYKYFEEGIANKCFGILSTVAHRCTRGHLT